MGAQLFYATLHVICKSARHPLDERDARAFARFSLNVELVHKFARARKPYAQARSGLITPTHDRAKRSLVNSRSIVSRRNLQAEIRSTLCKSQQYRSRLRILVDVPRHFRNGGRNLNLRRRIKTHLARKPPHTITHLHNVALAANVNVSQTSRSNVFHKNRTEY